MLLRLRRPRRRTRSAMAAPVAGGAVAVALAALCAGGCTTSPTPGSAFPPQSSAPTTTNVVPGTTAGPVATPTEAGPRPVTPVATGVGWSAGGLQGPEPAPGACHYGHAADGYALPDPACTPGAVDTGVTQADIASTICRSGYTSSVRPPESMTEPAKYRALAAYGSPGSVSQYEYDHLVPLELGGSSDLRNLWPQPNAGSPSQFDSTDSFGINAKDGVEDRLRVAVCSGQVSLASAQLAIAADWTTAESRLGVRP